jgi:hypothetical protein
MSDESVLTVDLDDPALQEATEYDPTQDINVRVVPPELDSSGNVVDYLIKLSIGENANKKKEPFAKMTKGNKKYVGLVVKAQIVASGSPWDKAFVNYPFNGVTTISFNGTNSMADLARVLGKQMPPKLSQLDQAAYVVSLLESEPTVVGRIQWRTYCSNDEKEIPELVGEANWPEKKDDDDKIIGHLSVTKCPSCKDELQASAQIKRLFPTKS